MADTSFLSTRDPARKKEKAQSNLSQCKGTVPLGTRTRSYKKGSSSKKTFKPTELDSAHSGKMTKGKDDQKLNHKERDIKNKHTSEQKSQPWAFEETTSKGRKNEKQGKA